MVLLRSDAKSTESFWKYSGYQTNDNSNKYRFHILMTVIIMVIIIVTTYDWIMMESDEWIANSLARTTLSQVTARSQHCMLLYSYGGFKKPLCGRKP